MGGSLDGWWVRGGRWGGWLGMWADGLIGGFSVRFLLMDGWMVWWLHGRWMV